MSTTSKRRHRTANTNSNPTYLQVALRPYRRGEPERYIVISTRTIQRVSPPSVSTHTNLATGVAISKVPDPRYGVTFRAGKILEHGRATRADLVAAGIPLPPGWS